MINTLKAKILVYISSATKIPHIEGNSHSVGVFLGELVEPLQMLYEAGHQIDFISPNGNPCKIDNASYKLVYWGFSRKRLNEARRFLETLNNIGMSNPLKISDVLKDKELLNSYDMLFIPGGQAPMTDVVHSNWMESKKYNSDTGQILLHFHSNKKITSTICHGGAALAAAPIVNGKWIYSGYNMTCVSMLAEKLAEDIPFFNSGGHMPDYPVLMLKRLGGIVKNVMLGKKLVIEDRELITAQDPSSAKELGRILSIRITEYLKIKE
ncbi:type 1 glutamine amidotransferase domain-containing protein [Sphingobacterium bovistauri]|uniref:Type 1 glutamine amidotransferase domain-containing protein n=1 Tax=Sphingobacterium bovistauri TaxID=2781959 RepID=A0ABS7Z9Q5_9SPHI|nr:type 1 glutamine amidotransferase domain-containing protein [Sphingobacterium bovistauri]MCA5006738.1 type 1 glutamine amidotransferase domain-containing protein [Sphingobacterium bovistauri]